jgi:hypothetical protein
MPWPKEPNAQPGDEEERDGRCNAPVAQGSVTSKRDAGEKARGHRRRTQKDAGTNTQALDDPGLLVKCSHCRLIDQRGAWIVRVHAATVHPLSIPSVCFLFPSHQGLNIDEPISHQFERFS